MAYTYPQLGSYQQPAYAWRDPASAGGVTAGFTEAGLGAGYDMLQAMKARGPVSFPEAPQLRGPAGTGFYDYTPSSPIQRIQSPDYRLMQGEGAIQSGYQGLMGGDYEKLQEALYAPAAAAAGRAYEQNRIDLENRMMAQGLYGGSEFARGMTENVGRAYQETLAGAAATAAAQRYGLQAQQQAQAEQFRQEATRMGLMREQAFNTFGLNRAAQQQSQEQNIWAAGTAEAMRRQQYNQGAWQQRVAETQGQIDFQNQQALMGYQNAQQLRAAGLAEEESAFNRYLAIAGLGAPMTSANLQYQGVLAQAQAQRDAAAKASGAATWGALAGAGGQVAGGLLGNQNFTNWLTTPSQPAVYNPSIDWGSAYNLTDANVLSQGYYS